MQRDRPLQNSMILPDSNNNLNKRPAGLMEYNFPLANVKKVSNFVNTESHFQTQHHNLVMQQQPRQQFQQHNSIEQSNQSSRFSNEHSLHDIYDKLDKLTRAVDKHEFQLSSLTIEGEFSKRVMNEVKKNMPVLTGGNDSLDQIFNLKFDIKNLQDELAKTPKMYDIDNIRKEMQLIHKRSQSNSTAGSSLQGSAVGKSDMDPMLNQLLRKRDDYFQNLLTSLETEISIVKKTISNMNLDMKVSPVVSNSCIILKYQELFKARNKNEADMVLSENTYYIDNQGFLLDCHSRYIVDQKGKKIKLQQKHISLLRTQKILQ